MRKRTRSFDYEGDIERKVKVSFHSSRTNGIVYYVIMQTHMNSLSEIIKSILEYCLIDGKICIDQDEDKVLMMTNFVWDRIRMM